MKQTKTVEQFFPKKVQNHHRLWPFMIFKVNNKHAVCACVYKWCYHSTQWSYIYKAPNHSSSHLFASTIMQRKHFSLLMNCRHLEAMMSEKYLKEQSCGSDQLLWGPGSALEMRRTMLDRLYMSSGLKLSQDKPRERLSGE